MTMLAGAERAVLQQAGPNVARLKDFIVRFAELLDSSDSQHALIASGAGLLGQLVATDDWLPDAFAQPDAERYRQYLLHCDSRARFSVVSFIWGPGQSTPIHDHTVWGLVGVLRGAELVEPFSRDAEGALISSGAAKRLKAGSVDAFGPDLGDIHRVANAYDDRVSISIHVYGADIGAVQRHIYDANGRTRSFVSGYANSVLPNFWGQS